MAYVIAISGASGAGKSTFAEALLTYLEKHGSRAVIVAADRYFKKELPRMISPAMGEEYPDWNHPDSVDMPSFLAAIEAAVTCGEYDHVIVEGVTILCSESIRSLADVTVYVDASIEMRIYRRIARNVVTKGQTIEFIGGYYLKCARYREAEYSLPSARYAELHVDNEWGFDIEAEYTKITELLRAKQKK